MSKSNSLPVVGDEAKQAIDSIRGYVYQLLTTTLAWVSLSSEEDLHIEVADDFAVATRNSLLATQVKNSSTKITINTKSVRDMIDSLINLKSSNPSRSVQVRYLTTSTITKEQKTEDQIDDRATLEVWKNPTNKQAGCIRNILLRDDRSKLTRDYVRDLNNDEIITDLTSCISWDTNEPDISEIEEKLIVEFRSYCATNFQSRSDDADVIIPKVFMHVVTHLTKSKDRKLTSTELKNLVYECTLVKNPKAYIDGLIQENTQLKATGNNDCIATPRIVHKNIFIKPRLFATRDILYDRISVSIQNIDICILQGAVGVGKSTLAKYYADKQINDWGYTNVVSDDSARLANKLRMLHIQCTTNEFNGIVVDGVDYLSDSDVISELQGIIGTLREMEISLLIVCYSNVSASQISNLNIEPESLVTVSSFKDEEIQDLLSQAKAPEGWLGIVHIMSGGSLPLLVGSVIDELEKNGWNENTYKAPIELKSAGAESEKHLARKRLNNIATDVERDLLYRLSLFGFGFSRQLVKNVAEVSPEIHRSNEILDKYLGTWIEEDNTSKYSVSTLLSGAALDNLTSKVVEDTHGAISFGCITSNPLDISIVDELVMHGIVGKAEFALTCYAIKICGSSQDDLENLSLWMPMLRNMRFDAPIYSDNSVASLMLRSAQLHLLSARRDTEITKICWHTLENELEESQKEHDHGKFEIGFLIKSLLTPDVHDCMGAPLDSLYKLSTLLDKHESDFSEQEEYTDKHSLVSTLFLNLVSTSEEGSVLIEYINQLEKYPHGFLEELFSLFRYHEYEFFAVKLLATKTANRELDELFGRVKSQLKELGLIDLCRFCDVERIRRHYDGGEDTKIILGELGKLTSEYGNHSNIALLKVDVLSESGSSQDALDLVLEIDFEDLDDHYAISLIYRDAAILAARIENWSAAIKYVDLALINARHTDDVEMRAFAIGLVGDQALILHKSGDVKEAHIKLESLLSEIEALPIDPIRCRYIHLLSRHVCNWIHAESCMRDAIAADGLPLVIYIGICSNPNTEPEIEAWPLAHLTVASYFLAMSEIKACGINSIAGKLRDNLDGACVLSLEALLVFRELELHLANADIASIESGLENFIAIESAAGLTGGAPPDLISPSYTQISSLSINANEITAELLTHILNTALILFSLKREIEKFDRLQKYIEGFSANYGINVVARREIDSSLEAILSDVNLPPTQLYVITENLFSFCDNSIFKDILSSSIWKILKPKWAYALEFQRVALISPLSHMENALRAINSNRQPFNKIIDTILSTNLMVSITISSEVREHLESML